MEDYERTGVLKPSDIQMPSEKYLKKGVAIVECVQEIPCNPCVDICPVQAISMENINALPIVNFEKCIGCTKCVAICPGLAIFVVKINGERGFLTLPYEFLPIPKEGEEVKIFNREGKEIGKGMVRKVKKAEDTYVITVETEKKCAIEGRHIGVENDYNL
ncbi:MAG: (4Fe-4S)-binding protein [Thermoplasmata archaeon]|nr:MAG: (4Fe-4S)-binding protein [Thermoplasmata archaeon]